MQPYFDESSNFNLQVLDQIVCLSLTLTKYCQTSTQSGYTNLHVGVGQFLFLYILASS